MAGHVAQDIIRVHQAGVAHMNITKENVVFWQQDKRWRLAGFDYAAPIGELTKIPPSLYSTDPETMRRHQGGHTTCVASAMCDVWAFGVLLFECITRGPLLRFMHGITFYQVLLSHSEPDRGAR